MITCVFARRSDVCRTDAAILVRVSARSPPNADNVAISRLCLCERPSRERGNLLKGLLRRPDTFSQRHRADCFGGQPRKDTCEIASADSLAKTRVRSLHHPVPRRERGNLVCSLKWVYPHIPPFRPALSQIEGLPKLRSDPSSLTVLRHSGYATARATKNASDRASGKVGLERVYLRTTAGIDADRGMMGEQRSWNSRTVSK